MTPATISSTPTREADAPTRPQSLASIVQTLQRELPALTDNYGVQSLGIFGSYVRGDAQQDSDLDVLVEFATRPKYDTLIQLEKELSTLVGINAQVIPSKNLYTRPYFGRNVLRHIVWLQQDSVPQPVDLDAQIGNGNANGDSMEPKREYMDFIQDIITSMRNAREFVETMTFPQMLTDRKTLSAVSYEVQIIGEAASKIPADVRALYPALDWKNIINIRNRLVHDYGKIDYGILWDILHDDIPNDLMFVEDMFEQEKRRRHLEDVENDNPTE